MTITRMTITRMTITRMTITRMTITRMTINHWEGNLNMSHGNHILLRHLSVAACSCGEEIAQD